MGVPLFPNVFSVDDDSATVNIAGLGIATFTDNGTHVFVAQATPFFTGAVGIAAGTIANPEADILDIANPAFGTYGLTTSIGPLSGAASGGGGGAFSFATSSGPLFFDSFFGTDGTFQAIVVPEPPSLALAGIAVVAGLGVWVRLRCSRRRGGALSRVNGINPILISPTRFQTSPQARCDRACPATTGERHRDSGSLLQSKGKGFPFHRNRRHTSPIG